MSVLGAFDTVSGRNGEIIVTIGGKVEVAAEIKALTASAAINKIEFPVIGSPAMRHKPNGWTGTGTMTLYYGDRRWLNMFYNYVKGNGLQYFKIQVTNEDKNSTRGSQRVQLVNCLIDGLDVTKIDASADNIETDISFTFEDIVVIDEFSEAIGAITSALS